MQEFCILGFCLSHLDVGDGRCAQRGPFRIIRLIRQLVLDPLNPVVTSCIFVEEPISEVLRKHTKIQ